MKFIYDPRPIMKKWPTQGPTHPNAGSGEPPLEPRAMQGVAAVATGSGSAFASLSPLAQELIVNAVMGEYDRSGPPDIPASVKAEIAAWAAEDESPNMLLGPTATHETKS